MLASAHWTPQRRALSTDEPLWLFGYGSLVWRPALPLPEPPPTRLVCLRGWRRVFWQGSTDHRGTPASPGRVVTLHPCPGACTWGVALRLPPPGVQREAVVEYLEEREKQYDVRLRAPLFEAEEASEAEPLTLDALVYVGSADVSRNVNYLGDAPVEELAATVASAEGPSGLNREYLFELAAALRRLGKPDEHVFALEAAVRRLLSAAEQPPAEV